MLAIPGVIVGFSKGIEASVVDEITVLWGTAELRGVVKLLGEGFLRFEMVGDKDMAVDCSVAVEFNEANSKEDRGHSQSKKGWTSLPRDSDISGNQEVWENSNT